MLESGVGIEPTFTGLQSVAITLMANHSKFGAPRGIRTLTAQVLNLLPLPIGLQEQMFLEGIEPTLSRS